MMCGGVVHSKGLSPRGRGNPITADNIDELLGPIPARAGEPCRYPPATCTTRAYPRAGGGTISLSPRCTPAQGLSPRGRGNPRPPRSYLGISGPIPARAGEPPCSPRSQPRNWAYPRAGGGTRSGAARGDVIMGLSPRGRGNRSAGGCSARCSRPIPARAGEPSSTPRARVRIRAYPRAGGGTFLALAAGIYFQGLSPRGRGNPDARFHADRYRGPIPARAGEPMRSTRRGRRRRAYPRAGGGTGHVKGAPEEVEGLSPRGRGNRRWSRGKKPCRGPIPARAGEPCCADTAAAPSRAYPRAGGGTASWPRPANRPRGLSPRGRGNRVAGSFRVPAGGPIPARAGEPSATSGRTRTAGAYPRAGGGTSSAASSAPRGPGLSPRGRGNLPRTSQCSPGRRPIPARAGEPRCRRGRRPGPRAYPRAGGGTLRMSRARPRRAGLSPRGRGNRTRGTRRSRGARPIPARAGEPTNLDGHGTCPGAYPRAGGGTLANGCLGGLGSGLSPRGRGNRRRRRRAPARSGPIPARAGEPAPGISAGRAQRAYPRAGGGTRTSWSATSSRPGLSPRGRGNPARRRSGGAGSGPIPARAGEPRRRRATSNATRAYPRAGGGTSRVSWAENWYPGLSPRGRGNRAVERERRRSFGPIPARAGEPTAPDAA